MRLMITRPSQDAAPLAERLQDLGHEVLLEPLLEICFREGVGVPLDGATAILATSANGVRAVAGASGRRDLPVFAVGDATARAARAAGFDRVVSAAGDVDSLAATVADSLDPAAGHLVHAAGTRVAGDLHGLLSAHGFQVERVVLYEARTAQKLSQSGAEAIKNGEIEGVLLFSPRTARTFVRLINDAGINPACRGIIAYCLSPAVAQAVSQRPDDLAWRCVCQAAHPDEGSLLELLEAPI
jgi:uroporphyrinogen-III synthase